MKVKVNASLASVLALAVFSLGAPSVVASTYYVTQSGFTAGGYVSGSFDGLDVNGDGVIASFSGEVVAFSLSFSGNAIVPAFTYGMTELRGLVYEVGTGFIGESSGAIPFGEGLVAGPLAVSTGHQYNTGLLPIVGRGTAIFSPAGDLVESSAQLLAVSPVPEPRALILLALGLTLLRIARRRVDAE